VNFGRALEFWDQLRPGNQLVLLVWIVRQKVYALVNLPGLLKEHQCFSDVQEIVVVPLRVLTKR
jgi:hypothetical protein